MTKVLQGEAERIDDRVAAVARGVLAMLVQPLANRFRRRTGLVVDVGIDSGRRRRNRDPEDVVQQPLATQDRRRAVGIRGRGQQRAFREQAAPLIVIRDGDLPEPAPVNPGIP
jgi:hypothetical protein